MSWSEAAWIRGGRPEQLGWRAEIDLREGLSATYHALVREFEGMTSGSR